MQYKSVKMYKVPIMWKVMFKWWPQTDEKTWVLPQGAYKCNKNEGTGYNIKY